MKQVRPVAQGSVQLRLLVTGAMMVLVGVFVTASIIRNQSYADELYYQVANSTSSSPAPIDTSSILPTDSGTTTADPSTAPSTSTSNPSSSSQPTSSSTSSTAPQPSSTTSATGTGGGTTGSGSMGSTGSSTPANAQPGTKASVGSASSSRSAAPSATTSSKPSTSVSTTTSNGGTSTSTTTANVSAATQAEISALTTSGVTLSQLEALAQQPGEKYILDIFQPSLATGSLTPEAVGRFIAAMKHIPAKPSYQDSHNIIIYTASMMAYLVNRQTRIY